MNNEYLQEKVMGEHVHKWAYRGGIDLSSESYYCEGCSTSWNSPVSKPPSPRDFSTPVDYCALEDKMRKSDELMQFFFWVWGEKGSFFDDLMDVVYENFHKHDRTQRADLIAEYFRSTDHG